MIPKRQSTERDQLLSEHVDKNLVPDFQPLTAQHGCQTFREFDSFPVMYVMGGGNQHFWLFIGQFSAEKVTK